MTIKVLIVDDSAIVRGLVSKALSADNMIEIVGTAANGAMAIDMARSMRPDIIILDIEMPVMDGITALPQLLKASPDSKVIMSSTLTMHNASITIQALELGASDYVTKPSTKTPDEVSFFYRELLGKVKALTGGKTPSATHEPIAYATAAAPLKPIQPAPEQRTEPKPITLQDSNIPLHVSGVKAIAIASSTGGPQALMTFFESVKGRLQNVPFFVTQHMPPAFTTILADHLGKASGRKCIEAKNGEIAEAGNIYLAAGDYHMLPEKNAAGQVFIKNTQDPPENFCRPAADPMLRALSKIYGKNLLVIVLTGMGQDGMLGAKEAVKNGGNVIAQNEASCVVYGMPRAVAESNICRAILPLNEIGSYITKQIEGR